MRNGIGCFWTLVVLMLLVAAGPGVLLIPVIVLGLMVVVEIAGSLLAIVAILLILAVIF